MNILVVGASRGSGAAAVRALAAAGHRVTAFARTASSGEYGDEVIAHDGDVMDDADLAKAIVGQDAVVVTLGISDNPLKVRLQRRASSPLDVRSAGTRRVVNAMREAGVRRLAVQTAFGIGSSRRNLSWKWRMIYALLLAPQLKDSAAQESVVRASGLDWTIIRPVALTDDDTDAPAYVDAHDGRKTESVTRGQLARVYADVIGDPSTYGQTLAVSS